MKATVRISDSSMFELSSNQNMLGLCFAGGGKCILMLIAINDDREPYLDN